MIVMVARIASPSTMAGQWCAWFAGSDAAVMEERSDGILLRPVGEAIPLLAWMDRRSPWRLRMKIGESGNRRSAGGAVMGSRLRRGLGR